MSESVRRVVLVGHCGPDSFMLKSAVQRAAPDAQIQEASSDADVAELSGPDALMLVNRVLDGRFNESDGISVLASLVSGGTRALLVSNYEDAQQRAEQAGALPGFGKQDLNTPHATERIASAVGGNQ